LLSGGSAQRATWSLGASTASAVPFGRAPRR
jgi:hypothetical protein